jgi:hypothetical protein
MNNPLTATQVKARLNSGWVWQWQELPDRHGEFKYASAEIGAPSGGRKIIAEQQAGVATLRRQKSWRTLFALWGIQGA